MKEIKLDSFSLFLILLVVLVISMVFMNWFFVYPSNEGFVSFQQNKNPLENVSIPQYSSTKTKIVKIYDNIFMDAENGNLIEVDGTRYTTTVDNSGSSIQKIWIASRENAGNPFTTYSTVTGAQGVIQTTDTSESKKAFVNSMTPFMYKSNSTNTNRNYVVYIPYNDTTFIHTITITDESVSPKIYVNANSVMYYHPTNIGNLNISGDDANTTFQMGTTPNPDTDASNNSFVILPQYDTSQNIFQMSKNTFLNTTNGHFIIKSNSTPPVVTVYNRSKQDVTTTYNTTSKESSIANVTFASWNTLDTDGNKMILYMGAGMKTVITIIEPSADGASFQIFKAYRFGANGTLDTELTPNTSSSIDPPSSVINPPSLDKDSISDYYKWYWYWNTTGGSDMTSKNYSEDYLLKTQIVPPVCPSCPMCPNGGTCTNCNGIGGSGVNTNNIIGNVVGRGNNSLGGVTNNAIDTTGNLLYNTGTGAVGLGKDAVGGAVGLGRDAVGGAVGLGREVVGGTVGLGREAVGGAVGLATGAVGGAVGLVRDAAGGILNAGNPVQLNDVNRSGYSNSYGGQGQGQGQGGTNQSSVTDPYSYYGARPVTGPSNYMPITADFSRFGR